MEDDNTTLLLIMAQVYKTNKRKRIQRRLLLDNMLLTTTATQQYLTRPQRGLKRFFRSTRNLKVAKSSKRPQKRCVNPWIQNSIGIHSFDILESTGWFEDEFESFFQKTRKQLETPHWHLNTGVRKRRSRAPRKLTPRVQLLLALHYLRRYPFLSDLAKIYGVHKSNISRSLHHTLPIIRSNLNIVRFPETNMLPVGFSGAQVLMDGTTHTRYTYSPLSLY
jgi:hypothetical protein